MPKTHCDTMSITPYKSTAKSARDARERDGQRGCESVYVCTRVRARAEYASQECNMQARIRAKSPRLPAERACACAPINKSFLRFSGFGCRTQGLGVRVSGFGFRTGGEGMCALNQDPCPRSQATDDDGNAHKAPVEPPRSSPLACC
jgi:hypothetical protein